MNRIKSPYPFFLLFFLLSLQQSYCQDNPLIAKNPDLQRQWVDSIYSRMSLEEKVGQLFMVAAYSSEAHAKPEKIQKLISENHIGGIIFSSGSPTRQADLTNRFQELSDVPLMIGLDAEWGLAMRLDSTYAFPWNMTLGAISDTNLIEQVGANIARSAKRLGVHINFAPVVDINTNPNNPIIGNRSFGENKFNVAEKALAFMEGMHREGVLSSAKHFPGHGDTSKDSHKVLPTITFDRDRIFSEELYPYRQLIKKGLSSVMVAHLNVPSLEQRNDFPSTLSHSIITGILKEEMDFKGLIFTDALNMKGVAEFGEAGEIELQAFLAGNDVLLFSEDVPVAIDKILEAYRAGIVTEDRLRHSVKKILYAKFKAGLHHYEPVDTDYLLEDLNSIRNEILAHELYEKAITVVKNDRSIIPIQDLVTNKIAYVHFGEASGAPFLEQLKKYTQVDTVSADDLGDLLKELEAYNLVIIGFHQSNLSPWSSHTISERDQAWMYEIARKNRVILNLFSSPYALSELTSTANFDGIVVGYQNSPLAQQKTAQILFGALQAQGNLPVTASQEFPVGTGYLTRDLNRLAYGMPEQEGMHSYRLRKIDSIMRYAIEEKMVPGMQVLVARNGRVVYEKNLGYQTYEREIPIRDSHIYDLASLTKILATLPLIMELVDKDELELKTTLGELFPGFIGTDKENITLLQMLSHYARFPSWIPFYRMTLDDNGKNDPRYVRSKEAPGYNTKIAEEMYVRNDIRDSIVRTIRDSKLERRLQYQYSDLPYYLLKVYLESIYGTSLAYLTKQHFYKPLGSNNTTYLPLEYFSSEKIFTTENDKRWRHQLLRGYVHDEGAALLGGIGGQAGLFSNATDVAKIMQMYLNGGTYGGKRFLKESTVDLFNTCHFCDQDVRRGVGFDKPQLEEEATWPTCGCVSRSSFGHSGFTGTFTWADPAEEIVYVFLSNRIHPSVENKKLSKEDVRVEIQRAIYEAIVR